MYEIWADDELIYSDVSPLETVKVVTPKLTLADSAAGQLDMSLPPTNVGYDKIQRMTTNITVKCDDEWIWSGRLLTDTYDFWNNRKMICEGELAFLNDSIQPPAKYSVNGDDEPTTIRSFLEALIDIHNNQVGEDRQFEVGEVTVNDGDQQDDDDAINRFTNYESTLECINDKLLGRLGGHIRIRHVSGKRLIDYITDDDLGTNTQTIQFGVNLTDFSKNIDMSDLSTAIVPRGARLEDESAVEVEGLEPYLTVKSLGEKEETIEVDGQPDTEVWHDDGSIFVKNPVAVRNFGWICSVVDWDQVTVADNLYTKAANYLKDEQYEKMVLEIKAIDLKYLGIDVQPIKFMTKVRCTSDPHGMDHTFIVSKVDLDLANPNNNYYTLGDEIKLSLTQSTSKVNSQISEKINSMPTKSEILRAAERNAYMMISGAANSYVHFIPGKDPVTGKTSGIQRIEVTDGPTYKAEHDSVIDPSATGDPFPNSLNRWIWTVGGLGHIGRSDYSEDWDDIGEMNVALQMTGAIVADMITAGTMYADRIKGGTLTLGGFNNENGQIDVRDSSGSSRIHVKNDGFYAEGGYLVTTGSGYVKHHERDSGDYHQWVFDLGCRYCNCEYEDGGWHWVNGGATEIYKYLEGAYSASDRRVKDNIESITSELAKSLIMNLDPVKFNYIYDDSRENFGMIAQDVWDVCDKLGIQRKNGLVHVFDNPDEMWDIEYKQFVPFLIKMVQDQQKEIEKLKQSK